MPTGAGTAMTAEDAGRFVGQSITRREDARFLTGSGSYLADLVIDGAGQATFVRSPMARAGIARIDVSAASAVPGVRAVMVAGDVPPLSADVRGLAIDRVVYVGEPVAIVVAETRGVAEDAADLVEVEYTPMSPVVDIAAGLLGERLVHPDRGSNIAAARPSATGPDVEAALAAAPHVFTETITQHRYVASPMETRGIVATPTGDGMTIRISSQGAHSARQHFARALGLDPSLVRVELPDVGGAFGQKISVGREETVVALIARRLGQTVAWVEDRWENLVAAPHARREEATISVGVDDAGSLLAMMVDHYEDYGAHGGGGAMFATVLPGPYRVPKVSVSSTAVNTTTSSRGAYRGPWMFETVVRETMLDIVARRLGIDPVEIRRRNILSSADLPYTNAMGLTYELVTPAETLEQALDIVDYTGFRRQQADARDAGRYLGIGVSVYIEPSAVTASTVPGEAIIRIDRDGSVEVLLGTYSQGHSMETTMAQVVAEHLGVDIGTVKVVQGDTDRTPYGPPTGGSRNAVSGGGAAREAAIAIRARVIEEAAAAMEAAPEDLELDRGIVSVRGTPTSSMSLAEVAALVHDRAPSTPDSSHPLQAAVEFRSHARFTYSNAAHVATCEVDVHTGRVSILRFVVSEDCGVMINPKVVEGQIAGGVVQGIGGVLLENFTYDRDGNPLTTTYLDYLLPTAAEVPVIEYGHVVSRSGDPGGFKGMGEGGAIGAPAAVINAVADALAPFGATVTTQPLTPPVVLALIGGSRRHDSDASIGIG